MVESVERALADLDVSTGVHVVEAPPRDLAVVVAVNVLWTKAREKRRSTKRGRISGYTTPWRKAVVTVISGQKIEFFEGV